MTNLFINFNLNRQTDNPRFKSLTDQLIIIKKRYGDSIFPSIDENDGNALFEHFVNLFFPNGISGNYFISNTSLDKERFDITIRPNLIEKPRLSEELLKIADEFKKRTTVELTDIAVLEEFMEKERKIFDASELMNEQSNSKDAEIETLTRDISGKVNAIFGEDVSKDDWQVKINEFKANETSISEEIKAIEIELASLSVNESDYYSEDVEIEFDQQKNDDFIIELDKVNNEIDGVETALETIKSNVYHTTGDDPLIEWDDLIDNLHKKRKNTLLEYQDITSEIVGGIAIHNVIELLREEEDTKIKNSLESDAVQSPLFEITQRYNKITFTDDDSMIISDDLSDFELSQLSTGALEQVMLALRIGFTSKLMGDNKLFLILDDAFQHSDWDKRLILVDNLVTLAQNDWQIIYFTMDNHIRDIFNEKGGVFGDDYKYHCIDEI